jgi:hypothetical protein
MTLSLCGYAVTQASLNWYLFLAEGAGAFRPLNQAELNRALAPERNVFRWSEIIIRS